MTKKRMVRLVARGEPYAEKSGIRKSWLADIDPKDDETPHNWHGSRCSRV